MHAPRGKASLTACLNKVIYLSIYLSFVIGLITDNNNSVNEFLLLIFGFGQNLSITCLHRYFPKLTFHVAPGVSPRQELLIPTGYLPPGWDAKAYMCLR